MRYLGRRGTEGGQRLFSKASWGLRDFFREKTSVRLHRWYSRAFKAPDHDRRCRRRQRPRTAAMIVSLSSCRVDSIDGMHKHESSRVGAQKRRFGCAPRLCMASRAHAVESRGEGLHNGSRRSRRRWRLRVRSPRLRLMVLDYSYYERRPQLRHLSQSFWPSASRHRIRRRGRIR